MYAAGVVAGQKHNSRSDFGHCAPRELGVGTFSERTCQEPMSHTVIRSGTSVTRRPAPTGAAFTYELDNPWMLPAQGPPAAETSSPAGHRLLG